MELFGSLLLFVFFIVVYSIIAEVFIVFFRFTGIPEEKARFQVISMLTNSGYTSRESEMFLKSKMRRKLARMTMMFGYAFTVTIVSSTVNVFIQIKDISDLSSITFIPVVFVLAFGLWFARNNKLIRKFLNKKIEGIAKKYVFNNNKNPVLIIDEYEDVIIAEVLLKTLPAIFVDKNMAESKIKQDYNIIALIVRKNGKRESLVHADTILAEGDSLVVMGQESDIRRVLADEDDVPEDFEEV